MPKTRPPYPPEFREQMVELVRAGRNPAELAREFQCSVQTIRNWVGQAAADAVKPRAGREVLPSAEREELARLRKENRILLEEREILKKATAFFAKQSR